MAVILAFATSALVVVRFWWFSSPYPPGLDGAQWLTYGRSLFGDPGRSAEGTYAPLIPGFAHGLGLLLGPVLGLRVLATAVLIILVAAVWLLSASALGWTWGSLTTALVVPCTALAEPFFYGGYPQQAALAFGLFGLAALLFAGRSRITGEQAFALLGCAAVAFSLASACHLLFAPLFLASGVLVAFGVGLKQPDRIRFLFVAAACLAPGVAISLLVARSFLDYGYNAPLSVSERTLQEAWTYATRESPGLWALIVIGGILSSSALVVQRLAQSRAPLGAVIVPDAVLAGTALVVPSAVLLAASGQPRLVSPLLLGGATLLAFATGTFTRSSNSAQTLAYTGWIIGVLWLAATTTGFAREFANYYQVLDASLIAATRSISSTREGSVAVPADRRGWPVGWWVEALQQRPIFTGSNPQWLAFPEELARAEETAALVASPDALVLRRRAEAMEVRFLLMRKWDWIGWERWLADPAHPAVVIYDDNETMVLEIVPASP